MNSEGTFRLAFCALLGVALLMRLWFTIRVWRAGERLMPDLAAIRREGWRTYVIYLLFLALIVLLARIPNWNLKLSFPLPRWRRWAGVALGLVGAGPDFQLSSLPSMNRSILSINTLGASRAKVGP